MPMGTRKLRNRKYVVAVVIIAACLLILIIAVQLITYLTRPHIQYSSATADCRAAAMEARDKITGSTLKNCVLVITAKNLKNESVFVDWNGVGGGPFAGWHPMVRINSTDGKFCYAAVNPPSSLGPYESRDLSLQCSGSSEKLPKNYSEDSDQNPTSIVIHGDFDTQMLTVRQLR